MNKSHYIIAPVIAALMLVSCQYGDEDARQEDKLPLLGIAAAGSGGSGREGTVPRSSLSQRRLALPQKRKQWTVLVYMDGDNNLSQFSSNDIREMMASGSGSGVNIVVLWDNDPGQDAQGAANRHGYYFIERSGATLLRDTGEINMGNPKSAKDFISYAVTNFPADHYLWVWWNHGGAVDRAAVLKGVCWDDTSNGDHLSESEQKDIMLYFKEKAGKKIDIVGFDACLMATAEIAYQYRDVASYLVASEQTEPGDGWDYRFLTKLTANPSLTPLSAAKQILTYYKNFYTRENEKDVTMSVFNLAAAGDVARALNDFAAAARSSGASGSIFRTIAKGLAMFGTYNDGEDDRYFTKDLYDYLRGVYGSSKVPAAVRSRAEACMKLIANKKFIVSEWHGTAWTNAAFGIAITLKHATAIYRRLDLCTDTEWDEFLNWAKFPDNDYSY